MMVGDVELLVGEVIFVSLVLVNRDSCCWGDDADRVVIDRADVGQYL